MFNSGFIEDLGGCETTSLESMTDGLMLESDDEEDVEPVSSSDHTVSQMLFFLLQC